MSEVAAIVLAAGRGTRFGEAPKLLACIDGTPIVRHVVEAALASGADPIHVVVGHRGAEIAAALRDLPIRIVVNPLYAGGLSTSLQAGFAELSRPTEGAVILLGDMPRVGPGLIGRLAEFWRRHGRPDAVVPSHAGRRGNPVLLSTRLAPAVAMLQGDEGAGRMLRARDGILEMPVDDEAVALDVDTPAALAEIAAQASTTPFRTAE